METIIDDMESSAISAGQRPLPSRSTPDLQVILDRYFFGLERVFRPLLIAPEEIREPVNPTNAILSVKTIGERLALVAPELEEACQRFLENEDKAVRATQALYLLEAGLQIDPASFYLSTASLIAAQQSLEEADEECRRAQEKLSGVREELRSRLVSSLGLLYTLPMGLRLDHSSELRESVARMVGGMPPLAIAFQSIDTLKRDHAALHLISHQANSSPEVTKELARQLMVLLESVVDRIGSYPYPLSTGNRHQTMRQYLHPQKSTSTDPAVIAREASVVLGRLNLLYETLLGELVIVAEKVEAALG